jgi:hypothetical protein
MSRTANGIRVSSCSRGKPVGGVRREEPGADQTQPLDSAWGSQAVEKEVQPSSPVVPAARRHDAGQGR